MSYQPSEEILEKYADILINFALHGGEGVKPKEVVLLQVPECAKPLLVPLRNTVLKAGAYPIINYYPDGISREFYEIAADDQLTFFPHDYLKGKIDQVDHIVSIIADTDKYELEGISPDKMMKRTLAMKPYKDWRIEKENRGELSWTLALYGTQHMAEDADMSLEEYWEQIIKACYLDVDNPIIRWKEILDENDRLKSVLDEMNIATLRIEAEDTDLTIGLGKKRKWLGGSGRNIPSFEVFISPDWRMTEGQIYFNQPLYRYGNLIKDIYLEFNDGLVTKASAQKGESVLREMIATDGADKVGEFSLTDSRMTRITKFMGETLFDENVGGKNGNTHIALGMAYKESYKGDPNELNKEQWGELGFNDSVIHTDIIATTERVVTATLINGDTTVIYKDGVFQI